MNSWAPSRAVPQPIGDARTAFALRPAWGLVGVAAGTALSVLLVPATEYSEPGAMAPAGLALAVGLLLGLIVSAARSPMAVFRTEHLLMFGLVYWILLDAIQGAYGLTGVPRSAVVNSLLGIGCFAFCLWLGSALAGFAFGPGAASQVGGNPGPNFLFGSAVLLFALGSYRYLAPCGYDVECVYRLFFVGRGGANWMVHGQFGDWSALAHILRFCGYLVLPLAIAIHHVEGRRITFRSVIVATLGVLFLILLVRDGGRRGVGSIVMAAALLWAVLQPNIRIRGFLKILAVGALLLVILQAMLVWRSVGIGRGFLEGRSLEATDRGGLVAVDRNFRYLGVVLTIVPDRHPHTGWDGVQYLALLPVPRALWRDKPGRAFNLPAELGLARDKEWYTITNSSVGDLYVIGGFLAIAIGGFLYGVGARLCGRLLQSPPTIQNRLIFAFATLTLFMSLRALPEIVITGYALAIAGGLVLVRGLIVRLGRLRTSLQPGITA